MHKPALDGIGFQDLSAELLLADTTTYDGDGFQQKFIGKQPAWINYMTNINFSIVTGTGGTNTQVILEAGTYSVDFFASIVRNNVTGGIISKMRVQNITDGTTLLVGSAAQDINPSGGQNDISSCFVNGIFTISSQKIIEIQQRSSAAGEPYGLPTSFGDNEVYLSGSIQKVK